MEIQKIEEHNTHLSQQQQKFLALLQEVGLPTGGVFVPEQERFVVFQNAGPLVSRISQDERGSAVYISKFFAAAAAGLFDSALNYIWDETVVHLRKRIEMYDVEYFYDNAVTGDKRRELKTVEDLQKLSDEELLRGARSIELITEVGYRKLDLVKFMRNNASAAHPNQNEITGLNLVSMADDCIREVVSTPIPPAAIEVQKLLKNIKEDGPMTLDDAKNVAVHFTDIGPIRAQRLAEGLFGIFYKRETLEQVRGNIRMLAPLLWPFVSEEGKKALGIRHSYFAANNNKAEAGYAKEFLRVVGGLEYVSDDHRAVDIDSALEELKNAHWGMDNFYNEVPSAKRLESYVGDRVVPASISEKYVRTVVDTFLTNGNGVSWAAEGVYRNLLSRLSPRQAIFALSLVFDENISSKLGRSLCAQKYNEMVDILESKVSSFAGKQLISEIRKRNTALPTIGGDERLIKVAEIAVRE